ncbi:uncharacterized protein LOC108844859 [Raphanus sativus]|uniref:Uncharacterized protein LOC108844859 n=1 Tax=Raphanus sativus TaxID=3726 RepID=A0A6J0MMD1_RAPSA|nr:uncharacterized protein LOC108844859 [Raphanus sativus]
MSSQLDKALLHLSLEEEDDEPFVLPDTPEYCSAGRNALSLVGRLLNPSCQKMSDLILDMPRKWQLYDRVRGVALSRERFQFIFKHEHDLLDILDRGVHTFQLWPIVMERWVEKPPEDYLQHIMVWVQMRNIPVNHYTKKALWALGDFAGQVVEVAFDPDKPQTRDYIRVLVKFNVAKPLRRFKKITTPGGEEVYIRYDYERLQKRCYTCQRLTHERDHCPFYLKNQKELVNLGASSAESKRTEATERLDEYDPLYGIIPEKLLGLDQASGKPKIAEEVMDGMRKYLMVADGPEKLARAERVKKSLLDLESDPIGRKTALMLEPVPSTTKDLDKGKGVVFDFSSQNKTPSHPEKLMASAISAGMRVLQSGKVVSEMTLPDDLTSSIHPSFIQESSTGFNTGFCETSMSGTNLKKGRARRRPGTFKRKNNGKAVLKADKDIGKKIGEGVVTDAKRKANEDVEPSQSSARFKKPLVVPSEGPSSI